MDLIIVAGMPATGKTTLSKKIAAALGMPLLEKDEIKEEMYKILGYSGLEDRRVDDIVANNILLRCTENILRSGTSLLIVNNFDKEMIDKYVHVFRKVIENHEQLLEKDENRKQGGRWYGTEN